MIKWEVNKKYTYTYGFYLLSGYAVLGLLSSEQIFIFDNHIFIFEKLNIKKTVKLLYFETNINKITLQIFLSNFTY